MDILTSFRVRGFVRQCSDEAELDIAFKKSPVTFYTGFDPTADSLHVGSLVPIMAMAHLQRAGHIPIAIIGGGTALIGDPSGKTEMRTLMPVEEIERNGSCIAEQLRRYLVLDDIAGRCVNNAEWLVPLNYIAFLRDIGRHFKVNEMIKAESYRSRLERSEGLSFIEFNYQLLQAYDFLELFDRYGCCLQTGGDDQWGNILAGCDLIRRMRGENVFGLTFPLVTTASGTKMGKTERGTVWLDASKTSPYDFYQYWINTDDRDVAVFMALFTFLSMDDIRLLANRSGAELRPAKEMLAFEATKLAHGEEAAQQARLTSQSVFGSQKGGAADGLTITVGTQRIDCGINVVDLLCETGLVQTKSEARRLITQGGAYVNDTKITQLDALVSRSDVCAGRVCLRKGKRQVRFVVIE